MKRALAAGVFGGIAAMSVAALGLGATIARRLTVPLGPRRYDLKIHTVERIDGQTWLVLDRTRSTAAPGIYNLWFERGGWVQLGDEVQDRGSKLIARAVTGISDDCVPQSGDMVSWSGIYFAAPEDAGLDAKDVTVETPVGPATARLIEGDSSMWAIHIHGLGGPRAGTLRGVQVATELGYTSLVVSFRNDGEGPRVGSGCSTLGMNEAADVGAAIDYAMEHGAERIVLFGWSMGAAIALQLAHDPRYSDIVSGLVLDSPVLNWTNVIKQNCKRAGLPIWTGYLAMPWLTQSVLARWLDLPCALQLDAMNWTDGKKRLSVPTLILHGCDDDSVPIADAQILRTLKPDLVSLAEFDAGHTLNWNTEQEQWAEKVHYFLRSSNGSMSD